MELKAWIDSFFRGSGFSLLHKDVIEVSMSITGNYIHIFDGIEILAKEYNKEIVVTCMNNGWYKHGFKLNGFMIFQLSEREVL